MISKSWLPPLTVLALLLPLSACVSTPYAPRLYPQNASSYCGSNAGYSTRYYGINRYGYHGYAGHSYSAGHSLPSHHGGRRH